MPPRSKRTPSPAPAAKVKRSRRRLSARNDRAWRLINREKLASLLGVHPDTVTDFARSGMPVKTLGGAGKEGVYDAVDCLDWWRSRQGKNAKEAAQTRAFSAQADLNELKLARESGELVSRDQVVLEGQSYTKAWVSKLRGLPRLLVKEGIIGRELEARVSLACAALLRDIASWKTTADADQAAKEADAA